MEEFYGKKINTYLSPDQVFDSDWIYDCDIESKPVTDWLGRWDLTYPLSELSYNWGIAVINYRIKAFREIDFIKCSTFSDNEYKKKGLGIIAFYCSEKYDRRLMETIGIEILNKMNYKYTNFILYKFNYYEKRTGSNDIIRARESSSYYFVLSNHNVIEHALNCGILTPIYIDRFRSFIYYYTLSPYDSYLLFKMCNYLPTNIIKFYSSCEFYSDIRWWNNKKIQYQ